MEGLCADAEQGLISAGRQLLGPCLKGGQPFQERDSAVIPQKAGGSRTPGRLHRPAWTESPDAAICQFFINPSPRKFSFIGGCTRFVRCLRVSRLGFTQAGLDASLGGCL